MNSSEINYITEGIKLASKAVFLTSLHENPQYEASFPMAQLEYLVEGTPNADEIVVLVTAYEAAYPRFQAMALAFQAQNLPPIKEPRWDEQVVDLGGHITDVLDLTEDLGMTSGWAAPLSADARI